MALWSLLSLFTAAAAPSWSIVVTRTIGLDTEVGLQASETLGKTAGKDVDSNKPTYVSVLGLDGAQHHAQTLRERAQDALAGSGLRHTARLSLLADLVVDRRN